MTCREIYSMIGKKPVSYRSKREVEPCASVKLKLWRDEKN